MSIARAFELAVGEEGAESGRSLSKSDTALALEGMSAVLFPIFCFSDYSWTWAHSFGRAMYPMTLKWWGAL
jgi:hypothetical protein